MDRTAKLSNDEHRDLFNETAIRLGITPFIAEKDFWVCWTLKQIFQDENLARLLMFKGGTSLSKVFHLITRFSEDIDLILDWNMVIGAEDPLAERSNSKQDILNKAIDAEAVHYISDILLPKLNKLFEPICQCIIDPDDGQVINVQYPAVFSDSYLLPIVRLEIGPLASWLPYGQYSIAPYASEAFPDIFDDSQCSVNAIVAERTFWEKATILHHEAHRPVDNTQPSRYSRHYYDLAMMARSNVKDKALSDLEMLRAVVEFKMRFYRRGWARYDLAKPGTFKLIPEDHVMTVLRKDYSAMQEMIFGEYPEFDDIMATLSQLEAEINEMESL
jgi:nucleotidyltransferase AbiEii toxin of type IV toxin-antitoxin system